MTTLPNAKRAFSWGLSVVSLSGLLGCGTGFDSPDLIKTLRVFAVQKDHPYAAPSEDPPNAPNSVNMTMLWHDGTIAWDKPARPIQRLWFSGCDDLPGDQYFSCLARIYELWQLCGGNSAIAGLHDGDSLSGFDCLQKSVPPDQFDGALQALLQQVNPNLPTDFAEAYFSTYRIGAGDRFNYPIPPRIIQNHQGGSEPGVPQYGLSFVFFTACAGHIDVAPEWKNLNLSPGTTLKDATLGFPFICLDGTGELRSDGSVDTTGKALGPDDYVAGYTEQFVYTDPSVNLNPIIESAVTYDSNAIVTSSSISFNGDPVVPAAYCIDDACVPTSVPAPTLSTCASSNGYDAGTSDDAGSVDDAGTGDDGCVPAPPSNICQLKDAPSVDACASNCPKYSVLLNLAPDKNDEIDTFASTNDRVVREQMWIDYYSDRGTINHAAKSLRDPTLGWLPDNGTTWTPPSDPGPVNIWAVVHDNRGGVTRTRLQVCVTKSK